MTNDDDFDGFDDFDFKERPPKLPTKEAKLRDEQFKKFYEAGAKNLDGLIVPVGEDFNDPTGEAIHFRVILLELSLQTMALFADKKLRAGTLVLMEFDGFPEFKVKGKVELSKQPSRNVITSGNSPQRTIIRFQYENEAEIRDVQNWVTRIKSTQS